MCGADHDAKTGELSMKGSSPRVRSRLHELVADVVADGIISACAEQTSAMMPNTSIIRDHLRVCGADDVRYDPEKVEAGSSPRVRSRQCTEVGRFTIVGIISACAEQTTSTRVPRTSARDHLRVCGADVDGQPVEDWRLGSSPRVRSRLGMRATRGVPSGIISACAEQTAGPRPGR